MSKPNPFLRSSKPKVDTSPPTSNRFKKQLSENKKNENPPPSSNRWSNIIVEVEESNEYGDNNSEKRNTFQRSYNGRDKQFKGERRFQSNIKRHGTMALPQNGTNPNLSGKYEVKRKSYFGVSTKKAVKKKEEFDLAKKLEDFPSLC